jgi:hypothetical protein
MGHAAGVGQCGATPGSVVRRMVATGCITVTAGAVGALPTIGGIGPVVGCAAGPTRRCTGAARHRGNGVIRAPAANLCATWYTTSNWRTGCCDKRQQWNARCPAHRHRDRLSAPTLDAAPATSAAAPHLPRIGQPIRPRLNRPLNGVKQKGFHPPSAKKYLATEIVAGIRLQTESSHGHRIQL